MKPLLLIAGLLAAVGLGAFLLLGKDGPTATPSGAAEMITRDDARATSEAGEEAALAQLSEDGESQAGRSVAEVEMSTGGAAPLVAALADSNIDASTAQRIEVSVVMPIGAPSDTQLRLIGWSDPEIDREDFDWTRDDVRRRFRRRSSGAAALQSLAERENDDEVRFSIHAISPITTSVEVLFDADASAGSLQLAGEYMYLSEPVQVDLAGGETAVTIEPKIGAWISGRVVTSGVKPRQLEDGSYGSARIQGGTMGRGRGRGMNFVDQSVPLDENLAFNFFGVNPSISIRVSADVPQLAPGTTDPLELVAGRKSTCEVMLNAGAAVRGRVVDTGGDPVAGASIEATVNGAMWQRGGGPSREGTTSKDGRFELQGIGDGSYRISAKREDWRDGRSDDPIEVEGGVPSLAEVLIVMDEGRVITGIVKLPSGAPAANASVRLSQPQAQDGGAPRGGMGWGRQRDTTERKEATADARGRFSFTALADTPARVAASVEGPDGGSAAAALEDVEPGTPSKAKQIELKLAPTVTIAGLVVDDSGAPVTTFEVRAARDGFSSRAGAGDGVRQEFKDREDGSFAAGGASAGTWKVSIRAEGYQSPDDQTLTITLPQEGAPTLFTLQRLGKVLGTVVNPSGVPIAGAEVKRESTGGFGGFRRERGVTTDEAGMFELPDLTAGVQKLVATSDGWAASLPTDVEVLQGAPTEGILLTLRRGGTIRGIVRDDSGNPWAGRRVTYATGGGPIAMFAGESSTETDAAGEFVFANVPPGKWSVTASPGEDEMMETMRSARDESGFFKLMAMNLTAEIVVADEEEAFVELGAEPRDPRGRRRRRHAQRRRRRRRKRDLRPRRRRPIRQPQAWSDRHRRHLPNRAGPTRRLHCLRGARRQAQPVSCSISRAAKSSARTWSCPKGASLDA